MAGSACCRFGGDDLLEIRPRRDRIALPEGRHSRVIARIGSEPLVGPPCRRELLCGLGWSVQIEQSQAEIEMRDAVRRFEARGGPQLLFRLGGLPVHVVGRAEIGSDAPLGDAARGWRQGLGDHPDRPIRVSHSDLDEPRVIDVGRVSGPCRGRPLELTEGPRHVPVFPGQPPLAEHHLGEAASLGILGEIAVRHHPRPGGERYRGDQKKCQQESARHRDRSPRPSGLRWLHRSRLRRTLRASAPS